MSIRSDQLSPDPIAALVERIRRLESQLRELRGARPLESASIRRGALAVLDTDGRVIARLGNRGDGFRGVIQYDRAGNYVASDDVYAGQGIARPYVPLTLGELSAPAATTTSATMVDLAAGSAIVQHAGLYLHLLVRTSDGTTAGEARLTVGGTQVGATLTIAAGANAEAVIGPAAVGGAGGAYGSIQRIAVQARRTAGSGTIGVRALSLLGVDSSWL
ncbi:hypothetical protein [Dactylosporangium sp. CA-139066]|uniref:hypothetical protein n=1 Tax=Dactylosporangium sp. CA-139066 TaxID=3239930 RepID=UPI003D90499B